ncbi:hypothetical protein [Methylomicrobium lacus]|uniref:hypothetical protein n=1 Tax=Methylomicrobium lacus TaxID=136992 RepID=UPI0035A975FE
MTHSLCNAPIQQELRYFKEANASDHWPIRLSEFLMEDKKEIAATAVNTQPPRLLRRMNMAELAGLSRKPGGTKIETPPEIASATHLLKRLRDFRKESWLLSKPSISFAPLGKPTSVTKAIISPPLMSFFA